MTERVAVGDLARFGHVWLLSIEGRDVIDGEGGEPCHGFGLSYPEPFTGAFAHAGTVWFQVGEERWDASTIASVTQLKDTLRKATYRLVFVDGSERDVTVKLPASVVAHKVIDVTYDEIESWSDDPIKLLPYTAADGWSAGDTNVAEWAQRVLPMWTFGVARGNR